jgi:hypothetical protein
MKHARSASQPLLNSTTPKKLPPDASALSLDVSTLTLANHANQAISVAPPSVVAPRTPLDVFEIVADGAVRGDIKCQIMILKAHQEISNPELPASESLWSKHEQYLVCRARLMLGLNIQMQSGRIPASVVETVYKQLFPKMEDETLEIREFNAYVHHAVGRGELSEARAIQILLLATADRSCRELAVVGAVLGSQEISVG